MRSKHPHWILQQEWKDLLFLHWKVDPALLEKKLPFPLDLFEGKAVLSIVPFKMQKVRFRYLPDIAQIPYLGNYFTSLWELNLRTYVRLGNKRGVYFFTLDTDHRLGQWIASHFFHLPYRLASIKATIKNNLYDFVSYRTPYSLKIQATKKKFLKEKNHFDQWATERYLLFTTDPQGHVYEGRLEHPSWVLEEVDLIKLENQFSQQIGIPLLSPPDAISYTDSLLVRFFPFQKLY